MPIIYCPVQLGDYLQHIYTSDNREIAVSTTQELGMDLLSACIDVGADTVVLVGNREYLTPTIDVLEANDIKVIVKGGKKDNETKD